MLKISVIGQDTLSAAIAECCSRHFTVTRMPDAKADVLWIAFDTPIVGPEERPDGEWVIDRIRETLVDMEPHPLILVSSQMPVGTTKALEAEFPDFHFAHSPENIRVASAVSDFENQARIVVGTRTPLFHGLLDELFAPFTKNVIHTDPETAELTKLTVNCWLAMNIVFIREIARICEKEGADPEKVSLALRTDQRCSQKAPLRPGGPYGGGHLARDIYTANALAKKHGLELPILANIRRSNEVIS